MTLIQFANAFSIVNTFARWRRRSESTVSPVRGEFLFKIGIFNIFGRCRRSELYECLLVCCYVCSVTFRPYFTYWVTFVQVTCFFFMMAVYGLADVGFHYVNRTQQVDCVMKVSMSFLGVQQIQNFRIWPYLYPILKCRIRLDLR